jgi:hypothetical protein
MGKILFMLVSLLLFLLRLNAIKKDVQCFYELANECILRRMFASRKKPQDFQTSLQRFTDLGREPASRAKHLKIVLDTLNPEVFIFLIS